MTAPVCTGRRGLFVGCGEPLEPGRVGSCQACTRAWTAKHNPGQPITPRDIYGEPTLGEAIEGAQLGVPRAAIRGTGHVASTNRGGNASRRSRLLSFTDEQIPKYSGQLTRISLVELIVLGKGKPVPCVRVRCACGREYPIPSNVWRGSKKACPRRCVMCVRAAKRDASGKCEPTQAPPMGVYGVAYVGTRAEIQAGRDAR